MSLEYTKHEAISLKKHPDLNERWLQEWITVPDQIGRSQVRTIEDYEIADRLDENSPFTYQDDIDPVEMAGFSIRRT